MQLIFFLSSCVNSYEIQQKQCPYPGHPRAHTDSVEMHHRITHVCLHACKLGRGGMWKNDIFFSHSRWPRSQQAAAAALDSVSTGHLALRIFTVSEYQASGTLTYCNFDSVSLVFVSSGLACCTYPHFSQLHGLPGFGSLWNFILSQRSQYWKQGISSIYINLSYRKCKCFISQSMITFSLCDGNRAASFTQDPPPHPPLSLSIWVIIASRGHLAPNYGGTAAGSNPPGCQQTKQIHRRDVL